MYGRQRAFRLSQDNSPPRVALVGMRVSLQDAYLVIAAKRDEGFDYVMVALPSCQVDGIAAILQSHRASELRCSAMQDKWR